MAGDIQTVGDVQILNPELGLCTLDEGAEIRMEFTVNTGKGYVPAERNRPEDAPIGLIPVDSLFSPVRKVSYRVENTREGQILDYDKLTMTIETNGSITPEDSLAFAARILLSSLQGAAVTSVHIDGVLHEFSSIPGVREDVTDIVLNIKDIAIKMQGEGPKLSLIHI